ncbi:methyltransferase domain-containing protein [bacterium TMED221]|nr:MAG: methyltransferase domain-containing protein [bacterium TMED221]|tara:strand:- start:778 stop:1449 length:672 start_codon:yes stop_codon:yes gene_type:complete
MLDNQNDLNEVIKTLALDCASPNKKLLQSYIDLLFRWHEKNNILSTRDKQYFIKRDLFDSLSMLNNLPDGNLLDIGTGAGIPGMLISFFRPDSHITLLDRRDNAIRFLEHAKLKLGINNVTIIKSDAKKMNIESSLNAVLIKNFSNKIISKLNFEDKLLHIISMIRNRIKDKVTIYMLTGSVALCMNDISKEFIDISQSSFSVKKLDTPYFDTNRYLLEINHA